MLDESTRGKSHYESKSSLRFFQKHSLWRLKGRRHYFERGLWRHNQLHVWLLRESSCCNVKLGEEEREKRQADGAAVKNADLRFFGFAICHDAPTLASLFLCTLRNYGPPKGRCSYFTSSWRIPNVCVLGPRTSSPIRRFHSMTPPTASLCCLFYFYNTISYLFILLQSSLHHGWSRFCTSSNTTGNGVFLLPFVHAYE